MLLPRGSEAISPTGHYTGYVWVRNGLAPKDFATPEGRVLFHAAEPLMRVSRMLGGPTFETMLVARHRRLDALLAGAIERGEVGQVIEIAAGLSARGWRFARRYGVTYVEADLPRMAARKRQLLDAMGDDGGVRVEAMDALATNGPESLEALAQTLNPDVGTAILTEGLVNYFPAGEVAALWSRFARVLRRFPTGAYFADIVLRPQGETPVTRLGATLVQATVRGRVHLHFADASEATAALASAGFPAADVEPAGDGAPGAELVHVVDAWT